MKGKLDSLKEPGMGRRPKKLIGTALLVLMVPFYALVVAALASSRLAETSQFVQIAFFAFFGLAWIVPAGAIIRWMAGPRSQSARR